MTKKEFKERCSFHEYGKGQNKRNAIYFGSGHDKDGRWLGFQFMVKSGVQSIGKQDLFNVLYDWVNERINQPPYYVQYRYAETDEQRFKVSFMG